jgi:hypothetical protein
MTTKAIAAVCLALLFATGCTSYYRVTDPTTGREYYTTQLDEKDSGAATLKDARTGRTVNLQNSEIAQISKEEYETGKVATPPQPAAAAVKTESSPFDQ